MNLRIFGIYESAIALSGVKLCNKELFVRKLDALFGPQLSFEIQLT